MFLCWVFLLLLRKMLDKLPCPASASQIFMSTTNPLCRPNKYPNFYYVKCSICRSIKCPITHHQQKGTSCTPAWWRTRRAAARGWDPAPDCTLGGRAPPWRPLTVDRKARAWRPLWVRTWRHAPRSPPQHVGFVDPAQLKLGVLGFSLWPEMIITLNYFQLITLTEVHFESRLKETNKIRSMICIISKKDKRLSCLS